MTLTWTAPIGATAVELQAKRSSDPDSAYKKATYATSDAQMKSATGTTVLDLTGGISYSFRLVVTDGVNAGISNQPTAIPLGNNSAELNLTQTTLAGVVLTNDNLGIPGYSESEPILLSVNLPSSDAMSAVFVPVAGRATVTAYVDISIDGAGGGSYAPIPSHYDLYTYEYLWIRVVSEDLTNTKYYKLRVDLIY